MDLLEHLKLHAFARLRLKRGAQVVVAVSGGVDSMVLLHALQALAPDFGWKLSVAHFNHQLRGRSSDADERLVRATARHMKLPCDVASADVRANAAKRGVSVEMAARELRHAFLAKCARRRGAKFVALAHHADDQVETFFLRLLRGAGGDGLGGMAVMAMSAADARVTLMRPLLAFSKTELAEWATAHRLKYREDASNAGSEFQRNWIRNELLPLLEKRQPALTRTVLRTMEIAGAEAGLAAEMAEWWLKHRQDSLFLKLPVAVQRWVVQRQLLQLGIETDFQLIESLRRADGKRISAGSEIFVSCGSDGVVCPADSPAPRDFQPSRHAIMLTGSEQAGEVAFGGARLKWRRLPRAKGFIPKRKAGREFFDADRIGSCLVLRHWRAGDRFQPIGMREATKLQDWFTNRKIPAHARRQLVLAETERGELVWVEGERIGELAKITPRTKWLLEWHWKRC